METGPDGTVRQRAPDLETFLGGMETEGEKNISLFLLHALKPSLVEWKPRAARFLRVHISLSLKPSLVEWKRDFLVQEGKYTRTLKPSLVEWKPFYSPFLIP